MELKEFIKNVLNDVTGAVKESEDTNYRFKLPQDIQNGIEFDLAILLKQSAEGVMKAEIFSVIGGKFEGNVSKENINRIRFRVIPQIKV